MQKVNCNAAYMLVRASRSRPVQRLHWDNTACNNDRPTMNTIFTFFNHA